MGPAARREFSTEFGGTVVERLAQGNAKDVT